jgi:hypothetical protein
MADTSSQSMSGSPTMEDPGRLACRLMQRAHNRDGLPEMAVGVFFLFVSAMQAALLRARNGTILQRSLLLIMAVLIPAICLASPGIIKWLRRRYLIAREGYFESKPSRTKRIKFAVGIVIGVAAALCAVVAAKHGTMPPDRWVLAGTGVLGGLVAALGGQSSRFTVGGLLMAVAGVAIGFSGASLAVGFVLIFGFTGAMALVSGVIVFRRFIRQTTESGE